MRELVEGDVVEAVNITLDELKKRMMKRRKGRGLPTLLKLYKMCFKKLLELSGEQSEQRPGSEDSASESDVHVTALVQEAQSKLDALLETRMRAASLELGTQPREPLLGSIAFRQLLQFLESRAQLNIQVSMTLQKLARGRTLLGQEDALRVLKNLHMLAEEPAKYSEYSEEQWMDRLNALLRQDKVEPGKAAPDNNCLFHSLLQILCDTRVPFHEDHQKLREDLVTMAMQQYQSPKLAEHFKTIHCDGLAVDKWAAKMRTTGEWGDEHCIEAFACRYQVKVLLYTPLSPGPPIKFPLYHQLDAPTDGVVRLGHVPLVDGELRPLHVVPLWPRRACFSPAPPGSHHPALTTVRASA